MSLHPLNLLFDCQGDSARSFYYLEPIPVNEFLGLMRKLSRRRSFHSVSQWALSHHRDTENSLRHREKRNANHDLALTCEAWHSDDDVCGQQDQDAFAAAHGRGDRELWDDCRWRSRDGVYVRRQGQSHVAGSSARRAKKRASEL